MVGMIGMGWVMNSDIAEFHMVKVEDLKFEDMVDLQGDAYADPNNDDISFQYEMEVVDEISDELMVHEISHEHGVLVEFQESVVCFPYGHEVKVFNGAYKPELIT